MLAPGSGTGLLATQCQDNLKVYVCNPMTSTSEIKFVISTLKKTNHHDHPKFTEDSETFSYSPGIRGDPWGELQEWLFF